jgi:replicative DNA helicase
MLAAESRVNAWSLRTGHLSTENDFSKIRDSLDRLSKAPIFIDDMAGNSIIRMRSICRRIKAEHGLGLIVVDYLQLMSTSKNYDNMVNQVTEISRSLKALAKEFNVPVLALSQLSRAVETRGGRPKLSDLRDSGSIEQDADVVMFIHREDRNKDESERDNITEILIEKHRNGPVGKVNLYFDQKSTTFVSIDKNSQAPADYQEETIEGF